MAYVKQTWVDGSAGNTPLSAARLNHIEDGIYDASLNGGGGGTGTGTVTSVNTVAPDGTGNVTIDAADVGARPDSYTPGVGDLPAGMIMFAIWTDSRKDSRPTSRSDVKVIWFTGGSTLPAIVTSGTGGMLNNVDLQIPLPS